MKPSDAPQIRNEFRIGRPKKLSALLKFCQYGSFGSPRKSVVMRTVGLSDMFISITNGKNVVTIRKTRTIRLTQ